MTERDRNEKFFCELLNVFYEVMDPEPTEQMV